MGRGYSGVRVWGLYRDHRKENGNYRGNIGDYIGIMEKKMETTGVILGII